MKTNNLFSYLIVGILGLLSCEKEPDKNSSFTPIPEKIITCDSILEIYDTTFNLCAIQLSSGLTGFWSIIENSDFYKISDSTNPNAQFIGALLGTYKLRWTVENTSEEKSADIHIKIIGFTDSRDDLKYKAVKIGKQIWMAENLRSTIYTDGSSIPLVTDNNSWNNLSTPAYCWYDNDSTSNANRYGAIYNLYVVETEKLCPTGWHVPTDQEWKELEIELGMSETDADNFSLKETVFRGTNEGSKLAGDAELWLDKPWWWVNESLESNFEFGSSGFSAHPAGLRVYSGSFLASESDAYWWTASECDNCCSWYRELWSDYSNIFRSCGLVKRSGLSVRCLKD